MKTPLFVLGLFLMAASLQGNGLQLWNNLKEQGAFVPWIAAIGGLWAAWKFTPAPYDQAVRMLIGVGILGLALVNAETIKTDVVGIFDTLSAVGAKTPAKTGGK